MNFEFFSMKDSKDIYSNLYQYKFSHKGHLFVSVEQAISHKQALLAGEFELAEKILNTYSHEGLVALMKEVTVDSKVWSEQIERIYYDVLKDKFSELDLKSQLLKTGSRVFQEEMLKNKMSSVGLRAIMEAELDFYEQILIGKTLDKVKRDFQNSI